MNEESKITPGPWMVNTHPGYESGKPGIIWGSEGPGHGSICDMTPEFPREFNSANANLIAAAPDLLAACEAAERCLVRACDNEDDGTRAGHALKFTREAIRRAKGGRS